MLQKAIGPLCHSAFSAQPPWEVHIPTQVHWAWQMTHRADAFIHSVYLNQLTATCQAPTWAFHVLLFFNSQKSPERQEPLLSPFYRWEKRNP